MAVRIVMLGLGRLAQELLSRLSRDYEITVVDLDPKAQDVLKQIKREDVKLVVGDATSRLVLEKCRPDEAEAVIITYTTERISREVARVLTEGFKPRRVLSVAVTEEATEYFKEMGFEVENVFRASATGLRNSIERKSKAAHAIGLGKEEILEVEVHPSSRLANKPLGNLKPLNWRLGIVYREGNIIVPKGDTILRPRDKVIILGDPQVLRNVAEVLTFNYQKFPLDYGYTMIAYLSEDDDEGYVEELKYIFSTFPFRKLWAIYPDKDERPPHVEKLVESISETKIVLKKTSLLPQAALKAAVDDCGKTQGLVAISSGFLESYHSALFDARKKAVVGDIMRTAECPILLCRGTFPYEKTVVPCIAGVEIESVLETALQISEELSSQISTLQVKPSEYISTEDEAAAFKLATEIINHMGLVYRNRIEAIQLTGNPIKSITTAVEGYNLLITNASLREGEGLISYIFKPDVTWNILRKGSQSALILPSWAGTAL